MIISVFLQLLDMMGSFLERPLIQKDFRENYHVLVRMCDQELDSAKVIFDDQLARASTAQGVYVDVHAQVAILVMYMHK